jgi:hypothetical protein
MYRQRWSWLRRPFAALAGTFALTLALGAAPAHAGGVQPQWQPGGCHRDTGGGPFTASACISAQRVWAGRGWVTVINTDAYIEGKPAGCYHLAIELFDRNGGRVAQGGWQSFCNTGRYVGPTVPWPIWGQPFYSELTIVSGRSSWVINSPYIG